MDWLQFLLSGVCHQIPERCLHYAGRPLPLCARCLGTFLGMGMAWLGLWIMGQGRRCRLPSRRLGIVLAALAGAWAVDGLNSFVQLANGKAVLYQPTNTLRLVTGLGLGLSLGVILYPLYHQILWRQVEERPVLEREGEIGWLFLAEAGLGAAILGWRTAPWWLWAWAGAGAVLVVLTVVNALLLALWTHREGLAEGWSTLLPSLGLGLAAALVEMGALAWLRRLLTGGA
jgi:uncharacterized membrane protein